MNGHIAAQGPIVEVMQDPEMLQAAHLRIPWLLEMGLAMQEAHPDAARGPLPRNREQMIARILNRAFAEEAEGVAVRSPGDAA